MYSRSDISARVFFESSDDEPQAGEVGQHVEERVGWKATGAYKERLYEG